MDIEALLCAVLRARPEDLPDMLGMWKMLEARTQVRLIEYARAARSRLLTPKEAALILGVTPRWMYDHAARLKSTRRPSPGTLRFEESLLRLEQGIR